MMPELAPPAGPDVGPDGLRMTDTRGVRPFQSSEEYLVAMKEDLAEWLNGLYDLDMTPERFMESLDTGTVLCNVRTLMYRYPNPTDLQTCQLPVTMSGSPACATYN